MIPWSDQVGTPDGLDGFFHFLSSVEFGAACLINVRISLRRSTRQSVDEDALPSCSVIGWLPMGANALNQATPRSGFGSNELSGLTPMPKA
jgi:hypothetical protein